MVLHKLTEPYQGLLNNHREKVRKVTSGEWQLEDLVNECKKLSDDEIIFDYKEENDRHKATIGVTLGPEYKLLLSGVGPGKKTAVCDLLMKLHTFSFFFKLLLFNEEHFECVHCECQYDEE